MNATDAEILATIEQEMKHFSDFLAKYQSELANSKERFFLETPSGWTLDDYKLYILHKPVCNISNLSLVIKKFQEKINKPIIIFIEGSELITLEKESNLNLFHDNPKISEILLLIYNNIIWVTERFLEMIENKNRNIQDFMHQLEQLENKSSKEFKLIEALKNVEETKITKITEQFEIYKNKTIIYRNYWLSILRQPLLLDNVPKAIFEIFIKLDDEVIDFIYDHYSIIPRIYRIKWLYKILNNNRLRNTIQIEIFIEDIIILSKSYKTNRDDFESILIMSDLINISQQMTISTDNKNLIIFISTLLSIISDINTNIKNNKMIYILLNTINKILELNKEINGATLEYRFPILRSYLIYYIPFVLNMNYNTINASTTTSGGTTGVSTRTIDTSINECIENIIIKILTEPIAKYYIAITISEFKIKINDKKLQDIIKLYTLIESTIDFKLIDPIMSCLIIWPYIIPGGNEVIDKNIMETTLFQTGKNPFTNESMTIEELQEYNNKPDIMQQNNLLKESIKALLQINK